MMGSPPDVPAGFFVFCLCGQNGKPQAGMAHLLVHFGRSQLSRARRGTILISPADQRYIKQLFAQYGIAEEPAFDSYVEEYDWLARAFPAKH